MKERPSDNRTIFYRVMMQGKRHPCKKEPSFQLALSLKDRRESVRVEAGEEVLSMEFHAERTKLKNIQKWELRTVLTVQAICRLQNRVDGQRRNLESVSNTGGLLNNFKKGITLSRRGF